MGCVVVTEPFDLLVGTAHGFADTVRCRGRGLRVDRPVTIGHNRIIRGGAVMPFTRCSVPACRQVVPHFFNLLFACQFAHEKRTLSDRPKDMCTGKSRHVRSRQQYFMVVCKRRTVR